MTVIAFEIVEPARDKWYSIPALATDSSAPEVQAANLFLQAPLSRSPSFLLQFNT